MKSTRVLAVIGYVLVILGLGAVVYQGFIANSTGTTSATIPAGGQYYVAFKTKSSMWMNAHIEGSIEVEGGETAYAYLLTSAQYQEYVYDLQPTTSLWSTHGSSGTFSVDLPGTGRYYVVANHDPGSSSIAQTVTLTYTISGINLLYVMVGAILLAVGISLSIVSLRMRKKDLGAAPVSGTGSTTEVKMFDSKQKLQ
jgi:uncharacterized membrane protein